MRIESVLFGKDKLYWRLADALRRSASQNSPHTPLTIHRITEDDEEIKPYISVVQHCYLENVRKTKHHRNIVLNAKNDEVLCLIDCDTVILRDLQPVLRKKFDVAITVRPAGSQFPFNTGVVFVRVSERTRDWYDKWWMNVQQLMEDRILFGRLQRWYGRINQCGLGMLLERPHQIKLLQLPCSEWNNVKETWFDFNGRTRVLHVLGDLRTSVATGIPGRGLDKVYRVWKKYDK